MLKVERSANLAGKHPGFLYQVEAVESLKDLEYGAVFHEQGLGKTKIGLDLALLWLKTDIVDSVLIVTKKTLIYNWQHEIGNHSFLVPRILNQDRRANFFAFNSPSRLYLTHYEVISSERKRLALFLKTRRVGVILDEAHKMKNPDSGVAQALHMLAPGFTRRLIMTGTPVANRPFDIWSPIRFLDHGASLGNDYEHFRSELDLSNDLARNSSKRAQFEAGLAQIFSRIGHFTVRKTKDTAGITLPDKHVTNIFCDLESRQAELYEQFRRDLAAVVVRGGRAVLDDAADILKRLLRLVQVASNPALVDQSYNTDPGKLPILENALHEIVDAGEKAIVWTSFTGNVDWLRHRLEKFGIARVHGKMAIDDRNGALTAFKEDPACRVLIATPGAAKEGLTLTVANHAIFFDRSFSLDDYLQAQDRIHRISQDKPCFVTSLIARGTVDEWVDALLAAKHLAAQLTQGDISEERYAEKADYQFAEIIREVLGLADDAIPG